MKERNDKTIRVALPVPRMNVRRSEKGPSRMHLEEGTEAPGLQSERFHRPEDTEMQEVLADRANLHIDDDPDPQNTREGEVHIVVEAIRETTNEQTVVIAIE